MAVAFGTSRPIGKPTSRFNTCDLQFGLRIIAQRICMCTMVLKETNRITLNIGVQFSVRGLINK